jgi:hypothetical protein
MPRVQKPQPPDHATLAAMQDEKLAAALAERKERAVSANGFQAWLSEHAKDPLSEYRDLVRAVRDSKCPGWWDLKRWSECLELHLDPVTCDEAIALLIRAESEWRLEQKGVVRAREVLEVGAPRERNTLSHVNPEPDEAVKCAWKNRAGMPCKAPTVPGTDRCSTHGGAIIDPDTRRSMLMSAYATIVEGASDAVNALVQIANTSRNDLARVNAAREILDRAGLTPTLQVNVNHTVDNMSPTEALMARLDKMRTSLNSDVIDVEEAPALPPAAAVAETEAPRDVIDVPSKEPISAEGKDIHPSVTHALAANARRADEIEELLHEPLAEVIQMPEPAPFIVPTRVPLR